MRGIPWLLTPSVLAVASIATPSLAQVEVEPVSSARVASLTEEEIKERFALAGNLGEILGRSKSMTEFFRDPEQAEALMPLFNAAQMARFDRLFPDGHTIDAWIETDDRGFIKEIYPFAPNRIEATRHIFHHSMTGCNKDLAPPRGTALESAVSEAERERRWKDKWVNGLPMSKQQAEIAIALLERTGGHYPGIKLVTDPTSGRARLLFDEGEDRFDYDWGFDALEHYGRRLEEIRNTNDVTVLLKAYLEAHAGLRSSRRLQLSEKKAFQIAALQQTRAACQAELSMVARFNREAAGDPRTSPFESGRRTRTVALPTPGPVLAQYLSDREQYKRELAQYEASHSTPSGTSHERSDSSDRDEPRSGSGIDWQAVRDRFSKFGIH